LLSGRWTPAVLAELRDGGPRYQDFDGVSHKLLADTLRGDEREGRVCLGGSIPTG